MKRFLTFNFKLLTLFSGAWQNLREWFDPAMEGCPYVKEEEKRIFANFGKISRISINLKQI